MKLNEPNKTTYRDLKSCVPCGRAGSIPALSPISIFVNNRIHSSSMIAWVNPIIYLTNNAEKAAETEYFGFGLDTNIAENFGEYDGFYRDFRPGKETKNLNRQRWRISANSSKIPRVKNVGLRQIEVSLDIW